MAIKLVFSNTVGVRVKGSINDAAGKPQPFDFGLTCKRLTQEEVAEVMRQQDRPAIDFLEEVVQGWSDVKAEDGQPVTYSVEGLRVLCAMPGMALIVTRAYLAEVGAKEKN
ncbi:hypothetical protein N5J23_04760 [Comamonas aquatica]|jgi:hypothetical protein|uniref:Phage protein n=1 Tax=Comamonas aquatica TaxID=225991 RepID=A0AA42W290_9BURK|nr:hypothetical protein [Comamonas aquatica]MDH1429098.1 hypothetical protein [Comamonas aquatica]MDH1604975.1 hypothetical protein [Comamonas aquatica]MDH1615999.1 hypothetical protein [Comamonas aquatica]MDH2004864.1 hypothetical protein [Comamonas aquatica]